MENCPRYHATLQDKAAPTQLSGPVQGCSPIATVALFPQKVLCCVSSHPPQQFLALLPPHLSRLLGCQQHVGRSKLAPLISRVGIRVAPGAQLLCLRCRHLHLLFEHFRSGLPFVVEYRRKTLHRCFSARSQGRDRCKQARVRGM